MMITCWNGSHNTCRFEGDVLADGNITTGSYFIGNGSLLTDVEGTPYYSDEEWINKNASNHFIFNESKFDPLYHNPTQAVAITGVIDGGTLTNVQHTDQQYDGITFNFSEEVGGLDLRLNFTGLTITNFKRGIMRYKTSNLKGDFPLVQMWCYVHEIWEDYPQVSTSETFHTMTHPVFFGNNHIEDGVAQMRIYKDGGNTQNHYYVDWVSIVSGIGLPSGSVDLTPYARLNDSSQNIIADTYFGDWNGSVNYWTFTDLLNGTLVQNDTLNTRLGDYVKNNTDNGYKVFFDWIGNLTNRVTTLFIKQIDFEDGINISVAGSTTITDTNYMELSGGNLSFSTEHPIHFRMHGEENANLDGSNGGFEFAVGNGQEARTLTVAPCDGIIYRMSLYCEVSSATTILVNLTDEQVDTDCGIHAPGTNDGISVVDCAYEFQKDVGLSARTTISGTTANQCIVEAWGRCY